MALNYFLKRHQISVMRALAAATPEARASHRGLAAGYARRIGMLQANAGAGAVLHDNVGQRGASSHFLGEPSENPDRGATS